jgi:hypothetical protein
LCGPIPSFLLGHRTRNWGCAMCTRHHRCCCAAMWLHCPEPVVLDKICTPLWAACYAASSLLWTSGFLSLAQPDLQGA